LILARHQSALLLTLPLIFIQWRLESGH
jgi:hypothetical protein